MNVRSDLARWHQEDLEDALLDQAAEEAALQDARAAFDDLVRALRPRYVRPRVCACGHDRSKSARLQREPYRNAALWGVAGVRQSITENA